jgi:stearoyl-CoA desaturase (delta-9 desaturase)
LELVGDLAQFPELRFLDRFDLLVPIVLVPMLYGLGAGLQALWPGLETSGMQFVIWGFCISTVVLYHCTFTINSLAHRLGSRRFETPDDSRNNWFLSLLTFGEGWHNNHHHYPGSVRMGFRWWEFDLSYYLIRSMAAVGLVWDLHPIPARLKKR